MVKRTIAIWGAGRIGRGFVADLFADAGYEIVFIDQAEALVNDLRRAGHYTVVHARGAETRENQIITGFSVLATGETEAVNAAVTQADLVAVAVFPRDFAAVAGQLVPGLLRRWQERPLAPLDVILCTNLAHAGPEFRAHLRAALPADAQAYADSSVGVVESLVIRMVAEPPAEELALDPLLIWTNGYAEFPVDRHAFKGPVPDVSTLRLVEDMRAEEMLKLYTYNTFHAALAYLGAQRGHQTVVDCLADPWVRGGAAAVLDEAARALQAEYGFETRDMAGWMRGVVEQTNNPTLGDTVARYGADPCRKLRRTDRLIGPLLMAHRYGIDAPNLVRAVAAALHYQRQGDAGVAEVRSRIEGLGLPEAIRALCELEVDEQDLVEAISQAYRRLPLEVEWAARADQAYQLGFEYERTYKGCGQCILAAVQDVSGLFDPAAFNGAFEAATGLAGGIGLCGDGTCSAFTGGALAFGLYSPRRRAFFDGDRENKYHAYEVIQRLRNRFVARYGSIRCHDIHQHELGRAFDLRDPAERQAFEAAGAHEDKCTGVVAWAAQWVIEIIAEQELGNQQRGGML